MPKHFFLFDFCLRWFLSFFIEQHIKILQNCEKYIYVVRVKARFQE